MLTILHGERDTGKAVHSTNTTSLGNGSFSDMSGDVLPLFWTMEAFRYAVFHKVGKGRDYGEIQKA